MEDLVGINFIDFAITSIFTPKICDDLISAGEIYSKNGAFC